MYKADYHQPRGFGFCIPPQLVSDLFSRHCHIDWHVLMGMIEQFVEAPDAMQQLLTVPSEILNQCELNECKAPTWKAKSTGANIEPATTLRTQAPWWSEVFNFFCSMFRF